MEEKTEKPKQGLRLRGLFITGLILILPLYITVLLVRLVIAWLKDMLHDTFSLVFRLIFGTFLGGYYDRIEWLFLFLIGLPIVIAFIIVVGWAAQKVLGKRILLWSESTVKKLPLLGGIYSAARQLVDTVFLKGKESYKRVVLVEYPRKGCWVIAFVTGESTATIQKSIKDVPWTREEHLLNVFVPTTPNPTSGFLVFFRKSEVIPLDISVEDGLKLVISGGILVPQSDKEDQPVVEAGPEAEPAPTSSA
jgi:uncharacterized membrane protein